MALPVMVKCQDPTPLTKSNVTIVKFDFVQGWEGLKNMAIAMRFPNRNHDLKFLLEIKGAIASVTKVLTFSNDKSFPRILKER
jgi:hypothetical protein